MHVSGAGRRVGEYCEQLWAQAKPLASLTRYMAKHNYLDCWDDFLEFVAGSKLANFVSFMLAQHRTAVRKLGECTHHGCLHFTWYMYVRPSLCSHLTADCTNALCPGLPELGAILSTWLNYLCG